MAINKEESILIEHLGLPDKGGMPKRWYFNKVSKCSKRLPKKMRTSNSTDKKAFLIKDIIKLEEIEVGTIVYIETADIFFDQENVWRKSKVLENKFIKIDDDDDEEDIDIEEDK